MEVGLLVFFILAVTACLIIIMAVYLQIYKHYINRVLKESNKKHIRIIPPYKVINILIALFSVVILTFFIAILPSLNRISTFDDIEQNTRRLQAIEDDWNMEIAMNDDLSAVLSYDNNLSKHVFSVYKNVSNTFTDYAFRYGGKSTSIERRVRIFKYENSLALLSMNALHIAKIECHNGEIFEIDPNSPFALVIPSGGFDVYGSDGNLMDLEQNWWYELTENND